MTLESGKTPFHKHHSNNWFRPESLIDIKISGWKFNEKQDFRWSCTISPQNTYKGNHTQFTVQNPSRHHFYYVVKVNIRSDGTN